MGIAATTLVDALRQYRLLEPHQLGELTREFQARFPDQRNLAKELIRRGWLTPYQVNQLLQDRGQDLLLGSYVLLERLGEGGMGQVFKARNWKLGQIVALKLIHPERVTNADAVRRFRREIKLAAHLNDPNIVRALDADQVGDNQLLVMEYVEGADLSRLVKESGPLPVREACDYIRQAALGLQHAYEQGLVHRDIKPSNLLLTAKGSVVKILDLGLARLIDAGDENATTNLTQLGHIVGTPDYIAPEQSRDSHSADIRSDLYSLGCSLYYLLTGQVTFPGMTATEKLIQHHLAEPRPVEQLRPEIPPAVVAVVRKLMAKAPADRYQTPAEVAAALQSWLAASRTPAAITMKANMPSGLRRAITQKAPVPPEVIRAAAARRRWPRAAALILLLLLGGGVAASWSLWKRPSSLPASTSLVAQIESSPRPSGKSPPTVTRPTGKSPPTPKGGDSPVKEPIAVLGEPREQSAVYALALSADGQVLASGGGDDLIHLWETRSWRERGTPLRGHAGDIRALAFTADGKMLASGSADKTVKLWDMATGREIATLQGHTGVVRALAFSSDGRTLASGADQDPNVRIWDVPGRKERFVWQGHEGGVHALSFPAEGKSLASGGADELIRVWDMQTTGEPVILKGHTKDIISLAYAPDGKRLVSGTSGGLMRIWNPPEKGSHHLKAAKGSRSSITALAFSADSKKLISTGGKGLVVLWDAETERPLQEWTFPVPIHSAALSPNASFLAAGTGAGTIHVLRPDPVAGKTGK